MVEGHPPHEPEPTPDTAPPGRDRATDTRERNNRQADWRGSYARALMARCVCLPEPQRWQYSTFSVFQCVCVSRA
eukprot:2117454-Prymnesium_polylepis.1